MEILESVVWVTLGFLPMLGSMELAWRLSAKMKRRSKRPLIEMVSVHGMLQK